MGNFCEKIFEMTAVENIDVDSDEMSGRVGYGSSMGRESSPFAIYDGFELFGLFLIL